jgi:hypothetical protein
MTRVNYLPGIHLDPLPRWLMNDISFPVFLRTRQVLWQPSEPWAKPALNTSVVRPATPAIVG